ncbi:MAG: DUF4373 domain-containing protein [Clostridia bacterium]|nr:DUF4373 domain-containing protein [Clostridia bacterium]
MARPVKDGLDYFPFDTALDTRTELILAEFGFVGLSIVTFLYSKIYGEKGYYCEWSDEVALLFSSRYKVDEETVSKVVASAVKRGIFDSEMYSRYSILTSADIQEVYFEAVKRRNTLKVKNEYLLIPFKGEVIVNNRESIAYNNDSIACNNASIVCNNTQTKVKETEKEIKIDKNISNNNKQNKKERALIKTAYETNIGPLSPTVEENLLKWLDDVDVSLIIYAIEKAVEYGSKKPIYIYAVLSNQLAAGNKTAEQAEKSCSTYKYGHCTGRKNAFCDYGSDGYELEQEIMKRQFAEFDEELYLNG